ncbi:MAG: hypothetical protein ICV60_00730 [Pyrinomonadaceae bacterium]|nr:hypothetical protein [Pyrinomonadaceae bacterium]
MKRIIPLLLLVLLAASAAFAQEQKTEPSTDTASASAIKPTQSAPSDPFEAQLIPRNAKIFIGQFIAESDKSTGFETYLAAAIRKKQVPVIMVTDRSQADFEISGSADKKGAGWAKKVFLGDWRSTTSASIQVVNLKTGVVAYADASHRYSANRGMRSSAEKLAKYLKRKIEDDEKKMLKRPATSTARSE